MDPRTNASLLRSRINDHRVPLDELLAEGETVFRGIGSEPHVRWLQLERTGYGAIGNGVALAEALGLEASDRLVIHVLAYRAQRGQIMESSEPTGRPFRHFFVEPLSEIAASAEQVQAGIHERLRLDFGPANVPQYPVAGIFPTDVFVRVLLGFRATLHLQLGSIR